MEYSQVVRHSFLVRLFKGSNPFIPNYIFGNMKNKKRLLLDILKTNQRIFKKQQKLVNRYQLLSEKQKKLNKITCYLALDFILIRIFLFCFNDFS